MLCILIEKTFELFKQFEISNCWGEIWKEKSSMVPNHRN